MRAKRGQVMKQKKFDKMIGRLDNILIKMVRMAENYQAYKENSGLSEDNKLTLIHHAEYMVEAGGVIIQLFHPLGKIEIPHLASGVDAKAERQRVMEMISKWQPETPAATDQTITNPAEGA